MTKYAYIRPAPAPTEDDPEARKHVRDPATLRPLPAEGAEVAWDVYWDRRLVDQDIEICEPPPAAEPQEAGDKKRRQGKD